MEITKEILESILDAYSYEIVMLMVDVSGSLEFGTIKQLKKDMVSV